MKAISSVLIYLSDAIGPLIGVFLGYAIVKWIIPPPDLILSWTELFFRNGLPVLLAAIAVFLRNLFFPTSSDRRKIIWTVVPSLCLFLLVEWIIPFITQYPGYGTDIEFVGFGIIYLLIFVIPFILALMISAPYLSRLGYRMRKGKTE